MTSSRAESELSQGPLRTYSVSREVWSYSPSLQIERDLFERDVLDWVSSLRRKIYVQLWAI